jgi:hypothetical protein
MKTYMVNVKEEEDHTQEEAIPDDGNDTYLNTKSLLMLMMGLMVSLTGFLYVAVNTEPDSIINEIVGVSFLSFGLFCSGFIMGRFRVAIILSSLFFILITIPIITL